MNAQHPVDLIGSDLRLVALPVAVRASRPQDLPGGADCRTAGRKVTAFGLGDADRDLLYPREGRGAEELFDFGLPADPDLGRCGRCDCLGLGGRRRSGGLRGCDRRRRQQ